MCQFAVEAGVNDFSVHHIVKDISGCGKLHYIEFPLPLNQSEKLAQVTSPLNGTTMTVAHFDATLQLLTKPRDGSNKPLEQMEPSRLSTPDGSLPRTQHSQSDAITNDTNGFTLSKQKAEYYQSFW